MKIMKRSATNKERLKKIVNKAEDFIGQCDGSFTITISEDE